MQPLVLAGSSSQTRLSQYLQTLDGYGVTAVPLAVGADCFQELGCYPGAALLLECSMVWGASSNGGGACFDETNWSDVPLILFVSSDRFDRAGEEMRIPIYGLFQQFPSREELICAIECARVSSAPFRALQEGDTPSGITMRRSNLEQDTFHSCRELN